MKIKYTIILCSLFLASCSLINQNPSQETNIIPPVSLSWNTSTSDTQISTGSIQTPSNTDLIKVWTDETKDITLALNNDTWALKIDYWTGARVKVHFLSEGIKNLKVNLATPWDINWNIRISQIIFPDGTSDGPFWKDMSYNLVQSGSYQVILFANMMAWDRWSWEVDLNLELK